MALLKAVLFDFSDTPFWRDGAERLHTLLGGADGELDATTLNSVWLEVKRKSATPAELAKCRDSSAVTLGLRSAASLQCSPGLLPTVETRPLLIVVAG